MEVVGLVDLVKSWPTKPIAGGRMYRPGPGPVNKNGKQPSYCSHAHTTYAQPTPCNQKYVVMHFLAGSCDRICSGDPHPVDAAQQECELIAEA